MSDKYTDIMKQLRQRFEQKFSAENLNMLSVPDVAKAADGLWTLLGQRLNGQNELQETELLKHYMFLLQGQIQNAFQLMNPQQTKDICQEQAANVTNQFLLALPEIQQILFTDLRAAYEGDPAAGSEMETLLCYPGILAVTYQRLAHFLHKQGVRILPRMITERAHQLTGIDIHPGAEIGPFFFIDHGTGVVIGETTVIGSHVKLYQGVTLGAKSFPLDEQGHPIKGIKRHPNIGSHVIIYAETTVLGNVTIGDGAVIGANKWITQDIPPNTHLN